MFLWQIDAHSERGEHRSRNEDCIRVDAWQMPANAEHASRQATLEADLLPVIIADGIGGHRNGDIAANLACHFLGTHAVGMLDARTVAQTLRGCHEHLELHEPKTTTRGTLLAMGTTVAAVVAEEMGLRWINVGDSRVYRFETNTLTQLSIDDHLPQRPNVLTQCLGGGLQGPETVHHGSEHPSPGTTYLLCSDGLTGVIDDETIAAVLRRNAYTPAEELLALARPEARDNISVIVLRALYPYAKDWRNDTERGKTMERWMRIQHIEPEEPGEGRAFCVQLNDHEGCPYVYRNEKPLELVADLDPGSDFLAHAQVQHVDDEGVHLSTLRVIGR